MNSYTNISLRDITCMFRRSIICGQRDPVYYRTQFNLCKYTDMSVNFIKTRLWFKSCTLATRYKLINDY